MHAKLTCSAPGEKRSEILVDPSRSFLALYNQKAISSGLGIEEMGEISTGKSSPNQGLEVGWFEVVEVCLSSKPIKWAFNLHHRHLTQQLSLVVVLLLGVPFR